MIVIEIIECRDWRNLAEFVRDSYSEAGPEVLGWAGASDATIDELAFRACHQRDNE